MGYIINSKEDLPPSVRQGKQESTVASQQPNTGFHGSGMTEEKYNQVRINTLSALDKTYSGRTGTSMSNPNTGETQKVVEVEVTNPATHKTEKVNTVASSISPRQKYFSDILAKQGKIGVLYDSGYFATADQPTAQFGTDVSIKAAVEQRQPMARSNAGPMVMFTEHVENKPLPFGNFTGDITKGQYFNKLNAEQKKQLFYNIYGGNFNYIYPWKMGIEQPMFDKSVAEQKAYNMYESSSGFKRYMSAALYFEASIGAPIVQAIQNPVTIPKALYDFYTLPFNPNKLLLTGTQMGVQAKYDPIGFIGNQIGNVALFGAVQRTLVKTRAFMPEKLIINKYGSYRIPKISTFEVRNVGKISNIEEYAGAINYRGSTVTIGRSTFKAIETGRIFIGKKEAVGAYYPKSASITYSKYSGQYEYNMQVKYGDAELTRFKYPRAQLMQKVIGGKMAISIAEGIYKPGIFSKYKYFQLNIGRDIYVNLIGRNVDIIGRKVGRNIEWKYLRKETYGGKFWNALMANIQGRSIVPAERGLIKKIVVTQYKPMKIKIRPQNMILLSKEPYMKKIFDIGEKGILEFSYKKGASRDEIKAAYQFAKGTASIRDIVLQKLYRIDILEKTFRGGRYITKDFTGMSKAKTRQIDYGGYQIQLRELGKVVNVRISPSIIKYVKYKPQYKPSTKIYGSQGLLTDELYQFVRTTLRPSLMTTRISGAKTIGALVIKRSGIRPLAFLAQFERIKYNGFQIGKRGSITPSTRLIRMERSKTITMPTKYPSIYPLRDLNILDIEVLSRLESPRTKLSSMPNIKNNIMMRSEIIQMNLLKVYSMNIKQISNMPQTQTNFYQRNFTESYSNIDNVLIKYVKTITRMNVKTQTISKVELMLDIGINIRKPDIYSPKLPRPEIPGMIPLFDIKANAKKKRKKKVRKIRQIYLPSEIALEQNIFSKKAIKNLTGIEIRPIIKK